MCSHVNETIEDTPLLLFQCVTDSTVDISHSHILYERTNEYNVQQKLNVSQKAQNVLSYSIRLHI